MTAQLITSKQANTFTVLMGGLHHTHPTVLQLTNTTWLIAYSAIWQGQQFTEDEVEYAKQFIANFLMASGGLHNNFSELVQRIILARNYILHHHGTYAPLPSIWFNKANKKGFLGTALWFQQIQNIRVQKPFYKVHLKKFVQAINELQNNYTALQYHQWRSYFVQHGGQWLTNLFLSYINTSKK